jgi:glycosyltransferase involved in cell wall biosynthesis
MTADTVGGVWTYAVELARALGERDIRVSLATMGQALTPGQRSEADQVPTLEIFESSYRLEWMDDPWADVDAAGEWLLGLVRSLQPDLVHLNGYAHGTLPWTVPFVMVAHSCVLSWWQAVKGAPVPPSWDTYRMRVQRGVRSSEPLIGVSKAMLDAIEYWYGPVRSGHVIYNGCRPELYQPGRKENLILSSGRLWDEAKNVRALDKAAAALQWPVCVAGEQLHPDGSTLSLQNVRALGCLSTGELRSWYGRASIYASPARYEPFGLSILEAALSGCALVLGDVPSLREIWGDAALYVPPDDARKLTVALNLLVSDKVSRDVWSRRARDRALTFTSERMVKQYLAAYTEAREKHETDRRSEASCAS